MKDWRDDGDDWPWVELSHEDAVEAWPRLHSFVEHDPDDLPDDAHVFVRRRADGGDVLAIEYADGHRAMLYDDLKGDETPGELLALLGLHEDEGGEWVELSREEGMRWLGRELLPPADARVFLRELDSGGYEVTVDRGDGMRTTIRRDVEPPEAH